MSVKLIESFVLVMFWVPLGHSVAWVRSVGLASAVLLADRF